MKNSGEALQGNTCEDFSDPKKHLSRQMDPSVSESDQMAPQVCVTQLSIFIIHTFHESIWQYTLNIPKAFI